MDNIQKHIPQIILLCGFLGFGKTTYAQKLASELPAILFTHDEIMKERFGRNPDDFAAKYKIVDDYIRAQTKQAVQQGQNVILDYGFWSKAKRREYYQWAKSLTSDVFSTFWNVIWRLPKSVFSTARKQMTTRFTLMKIVLTPYFPNLSRLM